MAGIRGDEKGVGADAGRAGGADAVQQADGPPRRLVNRYGAIVNGYGVLVNSYGAMANICGLVVRNHGQKIVMAC